ncbi:Protein of unknown function DUF4539 protein [Actinidia chinensis var. chinensis]|uniref:Homologous recombination OB-fold protein OB-fold domain-containing protein n=1 Tax=Actinidia chinensis var. chinensis TaxID=1590841 RepID=A0A2R6PDA3_ACTCC|nr:Protein of unknown function DUF4539 protein [Actinidia chinensis var. chinensis]
MEAWEALDLDDSDLPSLLRPCKRRRRHRHSNSQHSHQFSNSSLSLQQPPTSPSQTLPSPQALQLPSPNSTTPPLIPGPAGPVQAAMLRKVRAHQNPTCATQEYIRRAVEDGEEDEDFNRNPWLCALQFLGMVGGGLPITPLSSIVLCTYIGRVDRIVAVIKSSAPNGLGDLMVTLKDPTGTIDASIHHKVLAEVEFRKEISVGSVLILQKVAVFAPIRSTRYLNITLSNVVKVISKDTGLQLQQNYLVYAIKPVFLGSECNKETGNMHEDLSLGVDEIEGSMISGNSNVGGTSHNGKQMEMGKPLPQSEHCRDQNCGIVGKEPLLVGKDAAAKEILNKVVRIIDDTMDSEQRGVDDVNKLRMGSYSSSPNKPEADLVESQNDQVKVTKGANGVVKQRHTPPIPRASIPEWTDEQLNQLFAADCEDGGSLF